MLRTNLLRAFGVPVVALLACTAGEENIQLDCPEAMVLGEPLAVRARGMMPGGAYTIVADREDSLGRRWLSRATFEADATGMIEPARQRPAEGAYRDFDGLGLLWSASLAEPTPDDWQPPPPRDFSEIHLRVETADRQEAAACTVRQWIRPPGIHSEGWGESSSAELFLPQQRPATPLPAIVFLGGSGGGRGWATRMAGLFAQRGYAALAVAYFRSEGLPEHLAQVPVETVFSAIDGLQKDPRIDDQRLALMGYSKGAELALLVASRRPEIKAVAAIAPGSSVFQGFKPPKFPTLSSWTIDGVDLPFVPNAYDQKFFETFDGMYLWYRTLAQHEAVEEAAIPVEEIAGDILLVSGVDDRIWPATAMAEQIVARLYLAEFEHRVQHLAFPEAGHGIAAPPGEPTTDVAARLGGSAAGNAAAREQSWRALEQFFTQSLSAP
ncbi:MAG: acyl-CoA thioester hydrolase/BAAT C-terminal domain-containing protein [Acidobacteriota bacterium]